MLLSSLLLSGMTVLASESSVISSVLLLCLIKVDIFRPPARLFYAVAPYRGSGYVTLTKLIVILPRFGIDRPLVELDRLVSRPEGIMIGSTTNDYRTVSLSSISALILLNSSLATALSTSLFSSACLSKSSAIWALSCSSRYFSVYLSSIKFFRTSI